MASTAQTSAFHDSAQDYGWPYDGNSSDFVIDWNAPLVVQALGDICSLAEAGHRASHENLSSGQLTRESTSPTSTFGSMAEPTTLTQTCQDGAHQSIMNTAPGMVAANLSLVSPSFLQQEPQAALVIQTCPYAKEAVKKMTPEITPNVGEEAEQIQKLRDLRHKLQEGLLTKGREPKIQDMDNLSEYLKKLERMKDLHAKAIRDTRCDKLLRKITKLTSIPKESVYGFKYRAADLLVKWAPILQSQEQYSKDANDVLEEASLPFVIDLTGDCPPATEPELLRHLTMPAENEHVLLEEQPATPLASGCDGLLSPTCDGSSSEESAAASSMRKRKDLSTSHHFNTPTPILEKTALRRTRRKKSRIDYHSTENLWINEALKEYVGMLEGNASDLDSIQKKRKEFLRENDEEIAANGAKRAKLMEFKDYLIGWGAQDQKITEELEQSH